MIRQWYDEVWLLLLLTGFGFSAPQLAAAEETVLAQLGPAQVTHADVEASLLTLPPSERGGVLADPERVGNLLQTLLLRRVISQDVGELLSDEVISRVAATGRQTALAELALEFLPRTTDHRALEQRARALYEAELAAGKLQPPLQLSFTVANFVVSEELSWEQVEENAVRFLESAASSPDTFEHNDEAAELGAKFHNFRRVDPERLNERVREVIKDLEEGQVSPLIPAEFGFQVLRLDERNRPSPPVFKDQRSSWMEKAAKDLDAQGRREFKARFTPEQLAEMALKADLHETPTGSAYLAQAQEEALLKEYKAAYLAAELPDNLDTIARERYVTRPEDYMTQPMVDVAVVSVRGSLDVAAEELQSLAAVVSDDGIDGFTAQVKELTGAAIVRPSMQRQAPLKLIPTHLLPVVLGLLNKDEHVDTLTHYGSTLFVAVDNFTPARQRSYAEVAEEIKQQVRNELNEMAWRRKTAPYHQLELVADQEAIARLRGDFSRG